MPRLHLAGLALVLLAAGPAPARAETTLCTAITSLPAVISQGGTYCLKQDLATAISTGVAILIDANNVTLDCNGRKLGGLSAGAGTGAYGIYAFSRLNVTVRNCHVRGFQYGLNLAGSGAGHLVEDNLFDLNTIMAMEVRGDGSMIRRNRVLDIGGSTVQPYAYGISAWYDVDIIENSVTGIFGEVGGNGSAMGIVTSSNSGGQVSRNRVSGLAKTGTGSARGIWANAGRPVIRDNIVISAVAGDVNDDGITCNNADAVARGNVITGFGAPASPLSICTAVDNTIHL